MKIGILTAYLSRNNGGVFDVVCSLSQALHRLDGVELQIFGLEDEDSHESLLGWEELPINLFKIRGPKQFGYSPDLALALQAANLDLLHVHGIWMYPSIASLQWAKHAKKPYLITPHGMLDAWALQNSAWKKRLTGALYENAHLINATCVHGLCESEIIAMRNYGLKNPICMIPNGINLPSVSAPKKPVWKSNLPMGSKVLLYLGRLHSKKGLINLIIAWALIRKRNINDTKEWVLVIAGWDQLGHENELKALSKELEIEDSIRFIGSQFNCDKHSCYYHADAFILPSLSEGLPMVILEAWSYGLPVLMTPECNLPEGFQADAAIAIEGNQDSIAQGLDKLFSMSLHQRNLLGINGKQLVEERFTWSKVASDMSDVYKWMLEDGSRPSSIIND